MQPAGPAVLREMRPAAEEYFKRLAPACCRVCGGVAELGDQDEAAGELRRGAADWPYLS
jgi:hypothetical protein